MSNETQNPTYKCPVCNSDVSKPEFYISNETSMHIYSCPRCGDFHLQYHYDLSYILNKDIQKIAVLSHWIRTKHEVISKEPPSSSGGRHYINLDEQRVNSIIKNPPPSPAVQAENFVLWLGDNIEYADHYIEANKLSTQAIIGAKNEAEFYFTFNHLKDKGIIKTKSGVERGKTATVVDATLSFNGWERYKELKRGDTDSRKAFMAMEYGNAQLDEIVNEFRDAVKQTGFELFLLYERPKAGPIDDRLRVEVQTSRFLIADLTHDNQGAYWEAGYAEGLGKPVIYTCEKSKFEKDSTHFDTNHHLTILWDVNNRKEAAEKLKATIRATLPDSAKLTDD